MMWRITLCGFAAALAGGAMAQVTHVSVSRTVTASAGYAGNPPFAYETFSTDEVGDWEASARASSSAAYQRSSVGPTSIEFACSTGAGSGAGFRGSGTSQLDWVFEIGSAMRWDLTYSFVAGDRVVPGGFWNLLRREGDLNNHFANVDWTWGYPQPVHASGFLDPGRYRLSLSTFSESSSTVDLTTFALSVPSPGTLPLLGGLVVSARRNRRR